MKVQIVAKIGSRDHLHILVDEEPWREVHRIVLGRNPQLPSQPATLAELEQAFAKLEYESGLRYALWRLSRSAMSSMELMAAWRRKGISQETGLRIADWLKERGYLDDQERVRQLVACEQARGRGPAFIRAKLLRKGIPLSVAQADLEGMDDAVQQESVVGLLRTRYRNRDLLNPKERQKVIASLLRRGFSFDVVRAALMDREEI